jgi:hypothetical protein
MGETGERERRRGKEKRRREGEKRAKDERERRREEDKEERIHTPIRTMFFRLQVFNVQCVVLR